MTVPNDIKFSKERYQKYDEPAKQIAIEWLGQLGFEDIQENTAEAQRNFKEIWDVRGFKAEVGEWRIEAEIKADWGTVWTDMPFKWPTMDIPYRKRDKAEVQATHMMVIGGDYQRLFIVNRDVMLNEEFTKISSKWVRNRKREEPFFNIVLPAPKSAFWFKKNSKWSLYKE